MTEMVMVELNKILISEMNEMQVIVLKEVEGSRALPIWIGIFEAVAISRKIRGDESPRPMSHDLLVNIVHGLDAELERIEVNKLVQSTHGNSGTYHARLILRKDGDEIEVDSRPSDAIAVAVRMNAPIYVADDIFPDADFMSEAAALDVDAEPDWDKELVDMESGSIGGESGEEKLPEGGLPEEGPTPEELDEAEGDEEEDE